MKKMHPKKMYPKNLITTKIAGFSEEVVTKNFNDDKFMIPKIIVYKF